MAHTVSPTQPGARWRGAWNGSSSWGGLSSLLRPAATERRTAAARKNWWSGMSRLLRAAGANPQARPLHAVLAGGDFASSDWLLSR